MVSEFMQSPFVSIIIFKFSNCAREKSRRMRSGMAAQEEIANALGARQLKEVRASLDGSIESLSSYD